MELKSLLQLIHIGTSHLQRNDPEMYDVALYLIKWLSPIVTTEMNRPSRRLSALEGNHLTQAIAYWTNIPESIIIDTFKGVLK